MDIKENELKFGNSGEELYTNDIFKCGICQLEKYTIDDFVTHMLKDENCIMVMEPSSYLNDLFLPKFKRRNPLISKENQSQDSSDLDALKAVEIEIGHGTRRWKCKVCCLTFSRQVAVLNHFKLAKHRLPGESMPDEKDHFPNEIVKKETKEAVLVPEEQNEVTSSDSVEKKDDFDENYFKVPKIQNSPPICHICGQQYKSESIVASHIKIVHSEKRPFVCEMKGCSLSFKTKGSLVRHVRRHTGDRPFKCDLCGRSYRESGSLLRHQQSKTPCNKKLDNDLPRYGITLPFVCGLKADSSEMDYQIPLKIERIEDELPAPSETSFQEQEETKATIRKEILNKSQSFSHTSLASGTQEKKPLLKDLKKEVLHNESEEQVDIKKNAEQRIKGESDDDILRRCFTCPVCFKSFSKMTFLSSHLKNHIAELGSECSTCKKQFSSFHGLSRHLLTHSSVRQFECRQCGKAFKLKSHALVHLRSHSSIKSVPCSECGRLFKSVSSRNNHMKIHKGVKDFECSICFRKFLVKASFLRHLNVHTKDRPFPCHYCNQRFKEPGTLKRHIKFKPPCSQLHAEALSNATFEESHLNTKIKEDLEDGPSRLETLSEINDDFSELESYLSEKFDLSSIYSDHSDFSISPEEYSSPFDQLVDSLPQAKIKQEITFNKVNAENG